MKFKYLKDHLLNSMHSDVAIDCDCCGDVAICHLPNHGGLTLKHGSEYLEKICYGCIYSGKLIEIGTILCGINQFALFETLKAQYPTKSYPEILELKERIQSEIESKTPQVLTVNNFYWPKLGDDFAQFIGYASKPFLKELSKTGNGELFFTTYKSKNSNENLSWEMLPETVIKGVKEAITLDFVGHVFKGINSDEYLIVVD